MAQRHFFSTLHPLSLVIFATATVVAFVLLHNSRFNFHCYTQCEAMPTQKSSRKWRGSLSWLLVRKITKGIHSCKPASLNCPIKHRQGTDFKKKYFPMVWKLWYIKFAFVSFMSSMNAYAWRKIYFVCICFNANHTPNLLTCLSWCLILIFLRHCFQERSFNFHIIITFMKSFVLIMLYDFGFISKSHGCEKGETGLCSFSKSSYSIEFVGLFLLHPLCFLFWL